MAFFSLSCSDEATILGLIPTCNDGLLNRDETDVDCGGTRCGPCAIGQRCDASSDCRTFVGDRCDLGHCTYPKTCSGILQLNPNASTGVYSVAVDGTAPFPVLCDMTTAGGGWTRVGFEAAGAGGTNIQGDLPYLGIEVGTPDDVANETGPGLIGLRFRDEYEEFAITWGDDFIRMHVPGEIFTNDIDVAQPIDAVTSSDASLNAWISEAGGAIFCRAAHVPDVRPGDSSWAVKPSDSTGSGCGCNDEVWLDRGAFYGGLVDSTACNGWGGAWAGVQDVEQYKGGTTSLSDLSLWVR